MSFTQTQKNDQTLAQYLAGWASNLEYAQIPQPVINICKKALLDVVAVGIAGQSSRVSQQAQILANRFFSQADQPQALLFNGEVTSAKKAAYCNAVSAHALDMDDTCFAGIVHASVLIGPAILAFAQANQNSGEQVLTTFAVGSEITYSLGQAVGSSLYDNDCWPTGLLGVIGTAAAIAKLNGADQQVIARAIAFAALSAAPFRCMQGTDSKPLLVGETVKRAIDAVEIAQTDVGIPLNVFEMPESPLKVTVGDCFDCKQIMQLGQQWRLIDPGLVIKLFPLCSCAQPAVETLINIIKENNLNDQNIESISVLTTSMVKKTLRFDLPVDENQAMFSLIYPLACVLIDNTVKPKHISLASIARDDLKSAMKKITYAVDDISFNLNESPEAAIVTVKTHQGEEFTSKKLYPTGDPRSGATKSQFRAKIQTCLDGKIDVDKFINAFDNMVHTKNINQLTDHFKG